MAKIQRVGADHPECCQGNTGNGGCEYRRTPGSSYCPLHGSSTQRESAEKAELRQYKLNSIYATRAKDFANGSNIKNLSDEIALMRTTLETIFNSITNINDMMTYCDKIDKLATSIAKLVESWQKLQERNKELMSREEVIVIFDELLNVFLSKVTDPDALDQLAEECRVVLTRGLS